MPTAAEASVPLAGDSLVPSRFSHEVESWAAYIGARAARRACRDSEAPGWLCRVLRRIAAICLDWAALSLDLSRWTGVHWRAIR
jgi:hypothetical protein